MAEFIGPQPGPQTAFLSSSADIVIYGGSAGGGKSFGLLIDPARHIENSKFSAVIFRRTSPQLMNPGALWDEASDLYPKIGGVPFKSDKTFQWPSGMRVVFAHMEHEKNKHDWQGSQIPMIGFDEVTHFTESQFVYMMSRNRSASGVPGYIRATCNPDPKSWVRRWIDWWIKGEEYPKAERGEPIPERSGVIRFFIRDGNDMIWRDSREELEEEFRHTYGKDPDGNWAVKDMIKSFTFIPATIYDNKILMKQDPTYLASLNALPRVERARLLGGNWDVAPEAGSYYNREWIIKQNRVPAGSVFVRFWDRAASLPSEKYPDPDWTVGVLMAKTPMGYDGPSYIICDVVRFRARPAGVKSKIIETAEADGAKVKVVVEEEPGSSGKADAYDITKALSEKGFEARRRRPTGDKLDRYKPFSAAAENGDVGILYGSWVESFHDENESCAFDDKGKDDQCDAAAGAYNELSQKNVLPDVTIPAGVIQQNHWAQVSA